MLPIHIIEMLCMKVLFLQHYNSAKDLINMFGENEEKVKAEFFKLLRVKSALSITDENPLEIKKKSISCLF